MAKPGFWEDTFEKIAELGTSTVKATAKQAIQTVSPTKLIEKALGNSTNPADQSVEKIEKANGQNKNNTPLDFAKLQNRYQDQDKIKSDALRNRLFQLVKSGDEKILEEKKQKELEKNRKEEYEKQEKLRRKQQAAQQQQNAGIPQGKQRRSIFSPKKVARREQAEVKPSSGKQ